MVVNKNLDTAKTSQLLQATRRIQRADSRSIQLELISLGITHSRMPKLSLIAHVATEQGTSKIAFINGEAFGTSLVAQRILRRSAAWRPVLEFAGVSTVPSITLRSRQVRDAERFAKANGFPVAIHSSLTELSDNSGEVVTDPLHLADAMKRVYEKQGAGRVVVQKYYDVGYQTLVVVEGNLVAAIDQDNHPLDRISDELRETALSAVDAIPGLTAGIVQLRKVDRSNEKYVVTNIDVTEQAQETC